MKKVNLFIPLICFIIIMPFMVRAEPVASSFSSAPFKRVEREQIQALVETYEMQLALTDRDISNLEMEREWLSLKISRIQDQGRQPFGGLNEAARDLTRKIAAAQKRKNQLMGLIQAHRRDIEQSSRTMDQAGRSEDSLPSKTAGTLPVEIPPSNAEKALKESLVRAGLENYLEVSVDAPGLVAESVFPILFDTGKFNLTEAHKRFLNRLASFLKAHPVLVEVTGFTDYRKIRGTKMTNIELSAKRAGAVVQELRKNGMKASVFKVTGMGEYKKCLEKSERCRVLSRRADISIHFITQ